MAKILYHAVPGDWRKEQKYAFLDKTGSVTGVKWKKLSPDDKGNWITNDTDEEFDAFLPIGSKEAKASMDGVALFRSYSFGVSTNRDEVVYDFQDKSLLQRVERFAEAYAAEFSRWQKKGRPADIDSFANYAVLKWSRNLKRHFSRAVALAFDPKRVCWAYYRPFTKKRLYYARLFIDEFGTTEEFFGASVGSKDNRLGT